MGSGGDSIGDANAKLAGGDGCPKFEDVERPSLYSYDVHGGGEQEPYCVFRLALHSAGK